MTEVRVQGRTYNYNAKSYQAVCKGRSYNQKRIQGCAIVLWEKGVLELAIAEMVPVQLEYV